MFCNYCGAPNPEDSRFCRACGRAVELAPIKKVVTDSEAEANKIASTEAKTRQIRFPPIWVGFVIAGVSLLDWTVSLRVEPEVRNFIAVIIPAAGLAYWLYCVYRLHAVLRLIPGWNHPISPGRAVGFHLIPFYNVYWIFRWPLEVANFIEWKTGSKSMWGFDAGFIILVGWFLGHFFHPVWMLFLMFLAVEYVRRNLAAALRPSIVPQSAD